LIEEEFAEDYGEKGTKTANELHKRKNIKMHLNVISFDDMVSKLSGHRRKGGRTKQFESPPMWTDPFGYKFCVIVCSCKERRYIKKLCVSIYVRLMKGDNDDELKFPFPYRIQISIRNQSGRKDKSRVLEPNAQESFKRCYGDKNTGNENTPIGFSMFIEHDELFQKGFVRDGTMFVEVSVLKDTGVNKDSSYDKYKFYQSKDLNVQCQLGPFSIQEKQRFVLQAIG